MGLQQTHLAGVVDDVVAVVVGAVVVVDGVVVVVVDTHFLSDSSQNFLFFNR